MSLFLGSEIKGVYAGVNIKEAYVGIHKVFSAGGGSNVVHIGEHDYPYVKIGNLYWITQNLREPIGTLNTNYRIYDNSKTDIYGYHYNLNSLHDGNDYTDDFKAILPSGWRIPSKNDKSDLWAAAKDLNSSNPAKTLRALNAWSYEADNSSGFNCYPAGGFIYGKWDSVGNTTWILTTERNGIFVTTINIRETNVDGNGEVYATNQYGSVRLCKDA